MPFRFPKYLLVTLIVSVFLTLCLPNVLKAQNATDADIKTALLYNFIKYVKSEHFTNHDTLVLGLYGDDALLIRKLSNLHNSKVNDIPIKVEKLIRFDDRGDIDFLFVFNENNFDISRISKLIKGTSILLITDRYSEKREVMINFYHEGNKVLFEVNSKNLNDAGLFISPKLLLLGGTELDVRELYKTTEQSLITERERSEQIENELKSKQDEVNKLNLKLKSLFVQIDTLNSMVHSNILHIQEQKQSLDSMNKEQLFLTREAIQGKEVLASTNNSLQIKNTEIAQLDIQLKEKQKTLEISGKSLSGLKKEISERERTLIKQRLQIESQKIAIVVSLAFVVLLLVFLAYIYRNFKEKQARNIELEQRNQQINEQNLHIQMQAEQLLENNIELEKLSIVAEKVNNAVVIMDKLGNIEWANEGFVSMFGYTLKEFIEEKGSNFLEVSTNKNPEKLIDTCIKKKTAISYESEIITRTGENKWMHSTITPVLGSSNDIVKLVAIDTDITLVKKAELKIIKKNLEIEEKANKLRIQADDLTHTNRELEIQMNRAEDALNKLKNTQSQLVANEKMASLGQLTAGIAHEINNPISYISSSIEGLREILSDIKTLLSEYDKTDMGESTVKIEKLKQQIQYTELLTGFEELTTNIKMGIDRTKEIVTSLRTFSRIDEEYFSMVDINECIDSAIVLIGRQYKDRIHITKNYSELPRVEAIAGKINQVFLNILVNAIQAIPNEGQVSIGTSLQKIGKKSQVKIVFTDNGIGMTDEVKSKIFDPFFTTKDVGEGTGLGLSLTYSILKKHDAVVEVETKPAKGTSFIIYLPLERKGRNLTNS